MELYAISLSSTHLQKLCTTTTVLNIWPLIYQADRVCKQGHWEMNIIEIFHKQKLNPDYEEIYDDRLTEEQ